MTDAPKPDPEPGLLRDWRALAAVARARHRPLIAFALVMGAASLAFFSTIAGWFMHAILRWSGDAAISNFDLAGFFLSPQGVVLLAAAATTAFLLFFIETGGLVLIILTPGATGWRDGPRALARLFRDLPALAALSLRLVGPAALAAAAVLAAALLALNLLLNEADIYFYLTVKPPEFWQAAALVGVVALAAGAWCLWLLLRWIHALPLALLSGLPAREALRRSAEATRASGLGPILLRAVVLALGLAPLALAASAIVMAFDRLALFAAGEDVGLALAAVALSLTLEAALGALTGFAGALAVAILQANLYAENFGAPADAPDAAEKTGLRLGALAAAALAMLAALAIPAAGLIAGALDIDLSVKTTAHRGASRAAPENTLAALEAAIAQGADYAEIDVQRTSDGVLVLLHDSDLRRVAGLPANIWELDFAAVRALDVGSWFDPAFKDERVPTLAEAIQTSRGRLRLNVELKVNGHDDGLAEEAARVLAETGCGEACVVSSLDHAILRRISALAPALRRGLIVTASIGNLARLDVDFLAVNARQADDALVERARRAGMEVHAWTVNDVDQMLRMIHLGIDNILTSYPGRLVDLLEELEGMSDAERAFLMLAGMAPGRAWAARISPDESRP